MTIQAEDKPMKRNFYGILTNIAGGGMSYPYRHHGVPCTVLKFPTLKDRAAWIAGILGGYPVRPNQNRFAAAKRDCVYYPAEHRAVYVSEA